MTLTGERGIVMPGHLSHGVERKACSARRL